MESVVLSTLVACTGLGTCLQEEDTASMQDQQKRQDPSNRKTLEDSKSTCVLHTPASLPARAFFCLQEYKYSASEKTVLKWHSRIIRFIDDNGHSKSSFSIRNQPMFLGAVQKRYRPRHEKPAKSFQKWIDRIRKKINTRFIPSLKGISCLVSVEKMKDALSGTGLGPYDLSRIPDFNS